MATEQTTTALLLSSTYFGPVQWYQKLNRAVSCVIDASENFQKQTYRNRCIIASPSGPLALTVPVEHNGSATSTPMADLRISDHGNWRHIHQKALESAYGESAFYDYYVDDIAQFYTQRWERLFDFNLDITRLMCRLLDIHPTLQVTTDFIRPDEAPSMGYIDLRNAITPKHPQPDNDFNPVPYYQVYQQSNGFLPNLSILDLLFNMGPESIFYL